MANRLAAETSPYLLQHKDNPVDWRAWGPDAFAAARAEGKPILLSVGYAACHWCHVMAHESFEHDDTAALMNRLYVNVKVDREERPDVDAIFQAALSMMGEHGGWPLTMFLTPDGKPFWGGTYFPPEPRFGRPSFHQVLEGIDEAWRAQRERIDQNVTTLTAALQRLGESPEPEALDLPLLDQAARQLLPALDPVHGGLRGAPKFPQTPIFQFLWRAYRRTGDEEMGQAVMLLLDRMCQGGIYDHLGGGFARYSTDEQWLAPHFEKMLYDNAQMIELLTAVWRHTGRPLYAERVAETVEWLLREMIAEDGAFAATLDADSEGEEGKFYVWSEDEIDALLPPGEAEPFKRVYGVTPGGNWEGHTIFNRNHRRGGETVEVTDAKRKLWQAREQRPRPGRDDKVLADWNGLMIAALADAGFAFARPDWIVAARRAYDGVRALLLRGERLGHAYRAGRRQEAAMLDDYAAMARAALTLHEVTGEADFLDHARRLVAVTDAHYWDSAGGYFFTADHAPDMLVRTKQGHDTATPSGNGMMAEVLTKLFHLTGDAAYLDRAEAVVNAFSGLVRQQFVNMGTLLNAYETMSAPTQVVLVGESEPLLRTVAETDIPGRILSRLSADRTLPHDHPAFGKGLVDGEAAAYVCHGPVCGAPATTAAQLRDRLVTR